MKLKPGVKLSNLQPQLVLAILVADRIWQDDGDSLVVTSVNDSQHSSRSLHYSGNAVDLRTKTVSQPRSKRNRLADALGRDFDVLYEGENTDWEHIHIEYQPRR